MSIESHQKKLLETCIIILKWSDDLLGLKFSTYIISSILIQSNILIQLDLP